MNSNTIEECIRGIDAEVEEICKVYNIEYSSTWVHLNDEHYKFTTRGGIEVHINATDVDRIGYIKVFAVDSEGNIIFEERIYPF